MEMNNLFKNDIPEQVGIKPASIKRSFPNLVLELLKNGRRNILLTAEGGFGKSCSLIELYRRILALEPNKGEKRLVPIFIVAAACDTDYYGIRKYMLDHYYGQSLCISEEDKKEYIKNYDKYVLDDHASSYHFVIIVDGINESANEKCFIPEINTLSKFENVSVIVSSRNNDPAIKDSLENAGFTIVSLRPIESNLVSQILNKNIGGLDDSFYTPFYLSLLLKSGLSVEKISNQFDLINQYFIFTKQKLFPQIERKAFVGNSFIQDIDDIWNVVLPLICIELFKSNRLVFSVSDKKVDSVIQAVTSHYLCSDRDIDKRVLRAICKDILSPMGIIVPTSTIDLEYKISHEIFRDYFVIKYLRECDSDNDAMIDILKIQLSGEFKHFLLQSFASVECALDYFSELNNVYISNNTVIKGDAVLNENIVDILSFPNHTIQKLDLSGRDLTTVDFNNISTILNCDFSNSVFSDFSPFTHIIDQYEYMQKKVVSAIIINESTVLITSKSKDRFYDIKTGALINELEDISHDVTYTSTLIIQNKTIVHGTERGNLVFIDIESKTFEYLSIFPEVGCSLQKTKYAELLSINADYYGIGEDPGSAITKLYCLPDSSIIAVSGAIVSLINESRQIVKYYTNILRVISNSNSVVAFTDESFILFYSMNQIVEGKLINKLSDLSKQKRQAQREYNEIIKKQIISDPSNYREEHLIHKLISHIVGSDETGEHLDSTNKFLDLSPTYGFDDVFDFYNYSDYYVYVTSSYVGIVSNSSEEALDIEHFISKLDIHHKSTSPSYPRFSDAAIDRIHKRIFIICDIAFDDRRIILFDILTKEHFIKRIPDQAYVGVTMDYENDDLAVFSNGAKHRFTVRNNDIRYISSESYPAETRAISGKYCVAVKDYDSFSCWSNNHLLWTKKYADLIMVRRTYCPDDCSKLILDLGPGNAFVTFDLSNDTFSVAPIPDMCSDIELLRKTTYEQVMDFEKENSISKSLTRFILPPFMRNGHAISEAPISITPYCWNTRCYGNMLILQKEFETYDVVRSNKVTNSDDYCLLKKIICSFKQAYTYSATDNNVYSLSLSGLGKDKELIYWSYNVRNDYVGPYVLFSERFDDFNVIKGTNTVVALADGIISFFELSAQGYKLKYRQSIDKIERINQFSDLTLVDRGVIGIYSEKLIWFDYATGNATYLSINNLSGISGKCFNSQPIVYCQYHGNVEIYELIKSHEELQISLLYSAQIPRKIVEVIFTKKDEFCFVLRDRIIRVNTSSGDSETRFVFNKDLTNSKFTGAVPISEDDLKILSQYGAIY